MRLNYIFLLTLFFTLTLNAAYLYKDDVAKNEIFSADVEIVGQELFEKTGIHLYMIMTRELKAGQTVSDYEKEVMKDLKQPAVLLTMVELDKKIEIIARPTELYNDFNKAQILSPHTSMASALMTAIIFTKSFDDVKEALSNSGGSIIPLIAQRAKGTEIVKKYQAAMYNGYLDLASQIATSKGIELESVPENINQIMINILRVVFYSILLLFLFKYIRGKFQKKGKKNEQE
ncbi:MAG: 3-dehydroquinate dehydratase [Helicobacteraceae bacterium]|nr:3-dehydroquinate dehydratase [Helicobacteraceae bacterium]